MEHTSRRFAQTEESLLKQAKGALLKSIDAVLAAPPDNSWNTVRLHFENFDLDVTTSSTISWLTNSERSKSSVSSVEEAAADALDIPDVGTGTTAFDVSRIITSVHVVNDAADIYGEG